MSHINLDLQASHKMLKLLDEANANSESVIDSIPGIFLIINEDHEVLRANDGFLDILGLARDDIFRLPLARHFKIEHWKIFAQHIRQIIESDLPGETVKFELGLRIGNAPNASERPFLWTLTRKTTRNAGEGRLISVFGDDIAEMRETERRLTRVFTSIPLGIFTVGRDGLIGESYSSYLESMLGRGKLAGTAFETVLFGPARAGMDARSVESIGAIRACIGRPELAFEDRAARFPRLIYHNTQSDPQAGRWLKITYQPIVFEQTVEQLLLILEDRTAIVNAEREMAQAAHAREEAMERQRHSLEMYENAIRDPLTGLYTRLYMKDAVATLLWSHDHGEIPDLSTVIFDIDHFKRINDTYGHGNGDVVLSRVARAILACCRENDIPIRFGGEEFVVFMPCASDDAIKLAESARNAVADQTCDLGDALVRVTISGGVAEHLPGESLDDFMHRADRRLYTSKQNGRNRITFA